MNDIQARVRRCTEITDSGCWRWTGFLDRQGYGKLNIQHRWAKAHRASYEAFVGPIPDGLQIDHLCRNTSCVNPEHLEPVTGEENIRRRFARVTHCLRGHPFDEANTYRRRGGSGRACRACNRAQTARYLARKRAQGQPSAPAVSV